MKLVNTKELQKIISDGADEADVGNFFDDDDDMKPAPCYQMNVNRERKEFVFLIDRKEYFSYPYGNCDMSYDNINAIFTPSLRLFKEGNIKELQKFLKTSIKAK